MVRRENPNIYGKYGYLFKISFNLFLDVFFAILFFLGGKPSFSLLLASPISLKINSTHSKQLCKATFK